MPDDYFAGRSAERYDAVHAPMFEASVVEPAVDFLVGLADGGAALEFGIGTGRIALPLARRGVRVSGVDLSEDMVAQLRAKHGGEEIDVAIGDFATTSVDRPFSVVYLVFNTIHNLTTQDEQVACFQNAARHLEPGGHFVIEVGVPSLRRLPLGERFRVFEMSETYLGVDEFDIANQGLVSHHFHAVDERFEKRSIPFRYVWPSELDLMARLAGMTLAQRWSSWERTPFTSDSTKHVSVWEKGKSPLHDASRRATRFALPSRARGRSSKAAQRHSPASRQHRTRALLASPRPVGTSARSHRSRAEGARLARVSARVHPLPTVARRATRTDRGLIR